MWGRSASGRSRRLPSGPSLARRRRFGVAAAMLLAAVVAPAALGAVGPSRSSQPASPQVLDQRFASSSLAVGVQHSCALPGDGTVVCWGLNYAGQLGDGTTTDSDTPVTVLGGDGRPLGEVRAVAVGFTHTCAVLADGSARCWGDNAVQADPIGVPSQGGQLGDGTTTSSSSPVTVVGADATGALSGVVAIDAGHFRSCALLADSSVACWGDGQLTPQSVGSVAGSQLVGVMAISSAEFHTCALIEDGTVRCWGGNRSGELGDGTTVDSATAVEVGGGEAGVLTGVTAIAAGGGFTQDVGGGHTCALMSDATVRCWGNNDYGQLGTGVPLTQLEPNTVPATVVGVDGEGSLAGVIAVSAGWGVTCALLADTSVACWGDLNRFPVPVPSAIGSTTPLTGVTGIVTADRTCGVMGDGVVLCWYVGLEGGPLPLGVVVAEPGPEPSASPQPTPAASATTAPAPSPASSPALPAASGGTVTGGAGGSGEAPSRTTAVAFRDAVPTPADITLDPVVLAQTLMIAAAIMLFVPFPGVLFNNTLEANYAEITGRVRGARRRLGGLLGLRGSGADPASPGRFWSTVPGVAVFVLLNALLGSLLDPTFGPNLASLATYAGLLAGLLIIISAMALPVVRDFRANRIPFVVRALPGTIIVGLGCVLISRLTAFQPGYLYGLLVGVAARELSVGVPPRTVALSMAAGLAAAAVSWVGLLFVPAQPDPASLVAALQTALATVVVAGFESVAIGLLPLRFLPGESIFRWSRPSWGALFGTAVAGFLLILVNPSSGYLASESRTPLATIVVLLLAFGIGSVAFWAYFKFRKPRVTVAAAP